MAAFRELDLQYSHMLRQIDPRSQVRIVHFQPAALPAVTVLTSDAKIQQQWEAARNSVFLPEVVRDLVGELMDERRTLPVNVYLNADNPAVLQLAAMARERRTAEPSFEVAIRAIFNNAMLLAQHALTPQNAEKIFASTNATIGLMIDQTQQLAELQGRVSSLTLQLREAERAAAAEDQRLPGHICCMVALPFKDNETFAYENVLLPALREVLELDPFYWQVVRADEKYHAENVPENVQAWMQRSHAYVVDISDCNPNVMMELGYMKWGVPDRPRILLCREGTQRNLSDLGGTIVIRYPNATGDHAVEDVAEALRAEFVKNESALARLEDQRTAHYLSPLWLRDEMGLDLTPAETFNRAFPTMEALRDASAKDVTAKLKGLKGGAVLGPGVQKAVTDKLAELEIAKSSPAEPKKRKR